MIYPRFANHEKGFSMKAVYAWFFPAPRAGGDSKSDYKATERKTATGDLPKRRVFGFPLRLRFSGVSECASGKPSNYTKGADALFFFRTQRQGR